MNGAFLQTGIFLILAFSARAFEKEVAPLIEASCIDCHDADTKTRLNFEALEFDLSKPENFSQWEKIYDRASTGEMPPEKKPRPDAKTLETAMQSLRTDLFKVNRVTQVMQGRVPVRRLTRTEYEYTLHDLLGIRNALAKHLPPEAPSARFDTISTEQGISPVHIRSYLNAADVALDEAIKLTPYPRRKPFYLDYMNSKFVAMWFDRPLRNGGQTIMKIDDAVVTYDSRPHTMRSDHMGYRPQETGRYKIMIGAYGYQAKTPVTLMLMKGSEEQGGASLVGSFVIQPGETRTVSLETYLTRDDYIYPVGGDLDWDPDGRNVFMVREGVRNYKGEGLAVSWLTLQGPLEDGWPPASTRDLLGDVEYTERKFRRGLEIKLRREPLAQIREIVERIAPRVFRRPLKEGEADAFVALAKPALEKGRGFEQALRVSLRALLSSPHFLFHSGEPGPLDDFALATRLSYFLWKSLPDDELIRLATEKQLTKPETLSAQVDRMLKNEKSERFIRDFLGQWARLDEIDATTPDDKLYPEYDDVLRQAMLKETELFFRELISENLPARNLIKSDFTFVNARLARHYGIPDVEDEKFRKVNLASDSVRGGLMTQASVLKVTANGTVTSPVKRGAFVLTTLLGTPPSPPPPDIGSIEPDTRGATTIRETLDKHRNVEKCASCHKLIDPPGFALESFDPIGGFRARYRSTGKGDWSGHRIYGRHVWEYKLGPAVDSGGVTADGKAFRGIRAFRDHLLAKEEQVARNLIENLVVYATGGEIQFADHDEIDRMVVESKKDEFAVRSMIHRVVQSQKFRNK